MRHYRPATDLRAQTHSPFRYRWQLRQLSRGSLDPLTAHQHATSDLRRRAPRVGRRFEQAFFFFSFEPHKPSAIARRFIGD
jgi:hypothetical protein